MDTIIDGARAFFCSDSIDMNELLTFSDVISVKLESENIKLKSLLKLIEMAAAYKYDNLCPAEEVKQFIVTRRHISIDPTF